ncbi:hypothetical protein PO124_16395 [Bacillus licheniformis]|nr:hypothetical protein [Bacillus licheniformis]
MKAPSPNLKRHLLRKPLAGFLKPRVAATVNEVNAGTVAKERGISFSENFFQ